MVIPLAMLVALQSAGKLDVTVDTTDGAPKAGRIDVFRDDPLLNARHLRDQIQFGPLPVEILDLRPVTIAGSAEFEAGIYHARVRLTDRSAVWVSGLKVDAGAATAARATLAAPGTLKGTWTIDRSIRSPDGLPLEDLRAALVRDGHVWAYVGGQKGKSFSVPDVPPGTYSVFLHDFFEEMIWVQDGVKIESGRETVLKADMKRGSLGGIMAQFIDAKSGKPAAAPPEAVLVDERGRFAFNSNTGLWTGRDGMVKVGWRGLPAGSYVLHAGGEGFETLEKRGLSLRAPAIQKDGSFETEVYETVKVAVKRR